MDRDDELTRLDLPKFRYYQQEPYGPETNWNTRTITQLTKDVNEAHRINRQLVKEKDILAKALNRTIRKTDRQGTMLWIGGILMLGLWSLVLKFLAH